MSNLINKNLPIGLLDSGIGGITILEEISKILPNESVFYVGDEAHFPYGEKTAQQIIEYSLDICSWLENQGVKLIVVACNTITAAAIDEICAHVSIPVLGVVDAGVSAIIQTTKNNKVGILATQATINLGVYDKKLLEINPDIQVTSVAAPELVRAVEEDIDMVRGNPSASLIKQISNYCKPLINNGCDTVAMACTHFPPAEPLIANELGDNISIVSPSKKTAEEVSHLLKQQDMISQEMATYKFYTTGTSTSKLESFWKYPASFFKI